MSDVKVTTGNGTLLSSLYFTRSTRELLGPLDRQRVFPGEQFLDAVTVGKYPSQQLIFKIVCIEVFSSELFRIQPFSSILEPEFGGHVAGLKVTYELVDGRTETVVHGDVSGPLVGILKIGQDELLTGVTGRLKVFPTPLPEPFLPYHIPIAFLQFVVYNRRTGLSTIHGPFGSDAFIGSAFGSYGPILALEGTVQEYLGLSSIGFTRLVQGVPNFGLLGN